MIIASFNETEEYQTDAFLASIIPISLSLNISAQNIGIEYSNFYIYLYSSILYTV